MRLIEQDYAVNGKRLQDLRIVIKRLSPTFANMKAAEISAPRFAAYQAHQIKDGYKPATINREMAVMKRSMNLAKEHGLITDVPRFRRINEKNTRKGFFEPAQFTALAEHLPSEFCALFGVAYITGWRVKSELLTREWRHVDFVHGKLRLDPHEAKNDDGREFPFTVGMATILKAQRQRADEIEKKTGRKVTHVFLKDDGTPIRSFRDAWDKAVATSGINRIPHDFRRTAVRNLEIAGVPRSVAMKMIGHKTESIYRRYSIVEDGMMREAAKKLDELHNIQWASTSGQSTGTAA
jgi:site-specific recombinase XerD